jgi:sugar phosphate isomerase/epimerase
MTKEILRKINSTFLVLVTVLAVACTGKTEKPATQPKEIKFELGVASYSLRKFPLDQTLAFTQKLGIKHLALKSVHLPFDAPDSVISKTVQMCNDAEITLYAGGVIYMKTEAEVDQAFEYAKKAGMKMIVGVPNHELLPYVENKVKAYNIKLAIHNHGPGDKLYPSAESAYTLIKNMDPRVGLCIDIGHTTRIGRNASQDLQDFFDRVLDIHVKDETSANADGTTCEIGRGVIDFPAFIRNLVDLGYSGVLSLEFEKDENDPFAGMAESIGYVRGILDDIREGH